MQIVIDIPQITYNHVFDNAGISNNDLRNILLSISNSVILPDGHGRLIDEKEANALIAKGKNGKAYFGTVNKDWEIIDFLKTVPTIIEADEAGEEE